MNKTVYLRDEEVPVWEKARELASDKLSPIIVAALRTYISQKESTAKGFERIEIKFRDSLDNNLPKAKAFLGRWIIDIQNPLKVWYDNGDQIDYFAVAETVKGNVVVYTFSCNDDSSWGYKFHVYPSFQAAAADTEVNYAITQAVERRGVPVEELDI